MTRIKPERVVQAAAAIARVDLGARIRSTIEKFFVLKALGVSKDSPKTLTAQDVLGACNRLFGVSGRPPYNWYDPLTDKWGTFQPNGGWPVGTVWTQILRPNAKLKKIVTASPAALAALEAVRAGKAGGLLVASDSTCPSSVRPIRDDIEERVRRLLDELDITSAD